MRVLIIGKDSYIGNHIDKWLSSNEIDVEQLDVLNVDWKDYDYSNYDAIVHVAGIVHRPNCKDWNLYKKVNTDMPIEIASMAKEQGVKLYLFLSTMGVYGVPKRLVPNVIDENTPCLADSMYGKSKLMAEEGLKKLQNTSFKVAIVRPPSVYGKGCRGGYISGFASMARILPVIPRAFENVKQSFLYIDNLAEIVRMIIERNLDGTFCPQDNIPLSANDLLKLLTEGIGKEYRSSWFLGLGVQLLHFIPIIKKAYGGVEYSKELSSLKGIDYVVVPIEEGIKRTIS